MRDEDVPAIANNLRELYGDKALVIVAVQLGRAKMANQSEAVEMWHQVAETITAADDRAAQ
jgi:hypothetical protein